jgi:uncharacterized membrane protein YedE/YeeE
LARGARDRCSLSDARRLDGKILIGDARVCECLFDLFETKILSAARFGWPIRISHVLYHRPDRGGVLAAVTTVGWQPTLELGKFNEIWGTSLAVKAAVLLVGGFLWGYGSRMAKGCTSGNSISGLSKGSLASLVATCGFLIAGVAVTFAIAQISGVH